jgi:hypothetical protein
MVTKKEDPYYSNTKGATKKGLAPKPESTDGLTPCGAGGC